MVNRRDLLAAAGLTGVGLAVGGAMPGAAVAAPTKDLVWTRVPIEARGSYMDGIDCSPYGIWAVGADLRNGFEETRPLIFVRRAGKWVRTETPIESNSRLHSVAVAGEDDVWAVGVVDVDAQTTLPLALRWNGRKWREVRIPDVPAGSFADVVIAPDKSAWVSGWARVGDREHGVVYRHFRGRWHTVYEGLADTINGNALLAQSTTSAWLALNPGLAHFDGKKWTMSKQFPRDGSKIISAFTAGSPKDVWAVGVDHSVPGERALVAHFDGTTWETMAVPAESGQLYDVALRNGRPVVVGEKFLVTGDQFVSKPYVLEYRNGRFVEAKAPRIGSGSTGTLTAVAATTSERLWTAGGVDEDALFALSN